MIVRILGEGQFEVPEDRRPAIEKLDDELDAAVGAGDEDGFGRVLAALAMEVRSTGVPLAADAFAPSDLVVPFADATLEETRSLLTDQGEGRGDDR